MNSLGSQDLRNVLCSMAQRIRAEEGRLNDLDAAIGDGDHGITMRIGFSRIEEMLATLPQDASISAILCETGNVFMEVTGGAIGVIMGRMFQAAGNALPGESRLGLEGFQKMLRAMERGVTNVGKAAPGDKTLLDPLHAARVAAESTPEASFTEAVNSAACAADKGAEATANMMCRFGRASRLGERALGFKDPGAVSFSVLMNTLASYLNSDQHA